MWRVVRDHYSCWTDTDKHACGLFFGTQDLFTRRLHELGFPAELFCDQFHAGHFVRCRVHCRQLTLVMHGGQLQTAQLRALLDGLRNGVQEGTSPFLHAWREYSRRATRRSRRA